LSELENRGRSVRSAQELDSLNLSIEDLRVDFLLAASFLPRRLGYRNPLASFVMHDFTGNEGGTLVAGLVLTVFISFISLYVEDDLTLGQW
jgi:hypothetical protein